MPAKKKASPNTSEKDLNFEEALSKIEEIVESMESEELPLEDLVARYEAGSKLLKHCNTVLSGARKRIELITLENRDGSDAEATDDTPKKSPDESDGDPDDHNDIRLF